MGSRCFVQRSASLCVAINRVAMCDRSFGLPPTLDTILLEIHDLEDIIKRPRLWHLSVK